MVQIFLNSKVKRDKNSLETLFKILISDMDYWCTSIMNYSISKFEIYPIKTLSSLPL